MKTYNPTPIDTQDVVLPKSLDKLTEQMARNVHEVWAHGRMAEGWSYGEQRNDKLKTHPCLVPYDQLSDEEQEYDRQTALQTLKLIIKLGFKIHKQSFSMKDNITKILNKTKCKFYLIICTVVIITLLSILVIIMAPYFNYFSWLILLAITLISICAISWLGYYGKQLLNNYSDIHKLYIDTELSLYRDLIHRERQLQNEQINKEKIDEYKVWY